MPTVDHAVIAAAGLGSRLGMGMPKCLVEVHGRPILAHQLDLLRDVPDVRVVVGFEEHRVAEAARSLRPDVTIVRNPAYRSTTTLRSYALGARFLDEPCLFLDADIVFEQASFAEFLAAGARSGTLVGYTDAKTDDAVFVTVDGLGRVTGFSREHRSAHEWANVAVLPPRFCETGSAAVFERMVPELPLPGHPVLSWEVDREDDLERARREAPVPALS